MVKIWNRRLLAISLNFNLILRDPYDNFVSSWKYYHGLIEPMRKTLKSYNADEPDWLAEISEFLQDPWTNLKPFPYHHRYSSQFCKNPFFNRFQRF